MEKAWADPTFEKTQYLGKVKIQNSKNSEIPENLIEEYDLFINDVQFFDVEMNFENSNRGAKTLYFLKRNFNWMPFYIF